MRLLMLGSLLLAASSAHAQSTLKDAEGLWYGKDDAVDIKIENNTLTVVRSATKGMVPPGFQTGTVLGVANGGVVKINDFSTGFKGTCWTTSDGRNYRLMDCPYAYTLVRNRDSRDYDYITTSWGTYYRRSFFAKSGYSFEGRR